MPNAMRFRLPVSATGSKVARGRLDEGQRRRVRDEIKKNARSSKTARPRRRLQSTGNSRLDHYRCAGNTVFPTGRGYTPPPRGPATRVTKKHVPVPKPSPPQVFDTRSGKPSSGRSVFKRCFAFIRPNYPDHFRVLFGQIESTRLPALARNRTG